MNVLDENVSAEDRQQLTNWGIHVRQVGVDLGRSGMSDDEIIALLHGLQRPTLLTADSDFYKPAEPSLPMLGGHGSIVLQGAAATLRDEEQDGEAHQLAAGLMAGRQLPHADTHRPARSLVLPQHICRPNPVVLALGKRRIVQRLHEAGSTFHPFVRHTVVPSDQLMVGPAISNTAMCSLRVTSRTPVAIQKSAARATSVT